MPCLVENWKSGSAEEDLWKVINVQSLVEIISNEFSIISPTWKHLNNIQLLVCFVRLIDIALLDLERMNIGKVCDDVNDGQWWHADPRGKIYNYQTDVCFKEGSTILLLCVKRP